MNEKEYLRYWNSHKGLQPWNPVKVIGLSEENRHALCDLGFPIGVDCGFGMMNPVQVVADGASCIATYNDSGMIALLDGTAVICAEGTSGGIYINASLPYFLFSLTIVHQTSARLASQVRLEYDDIVRKSRDNMKLLDPTAFDRNDSFWPILYESFGVA